MESNYVLLLKHCYGTVKYNFRYLTTSQWDTLYFFTLLQLSDMFRYKYIVQDIWIENIWIIDSYDASQVIN